MSQSHTLIKKPTIHNVILLAEDAKDSLDLEYTLKAVAHDLSLPATDVQIMGAVNAPQSTVGDTKTTGSGGAGMGASAGATTPAAKPFAVSVVNTVAFKNTRYGLHHEHVEHPDIAVLVFNQNSSFEDQLKRFQQNAPSLQLLPTPSSASAPRALPMPTGPQPTIIVVFDTTQKVQYSSASEDDDTQLSGSASAGWRSTPQASSTIVVAPSFDDSRTKMQKTHGLKHAVAIEHNPEKGQNATETLITQVSLAIQERIPEDLRRKAITPQQKIRLDAFYKIYDIMFKTEDVWYHYLPGFQKDFRTALAGLSDYDKVKAIEARMVASKGGRTDEAWRLAAVHMGNVNDQNQALFEALHKHSLKNSGWFARTKAIEMEEVQAPSAAATEDDSSGLGLGFGVGPLPKSNSSSAAINGERVSVSDKSATFFRVAAIEKAVTAQEASYQNIRDVDQKSNTRSGKIKSLMIGGK